MVYVLNMLGQPIMPTTDYRKVRLLLTQGKAIVVKRKPFTIRLTVRVKTYIQPVIELLVLIIGCIANIKVGWHHQ